MIDLFALLLAQMSMLSMLLELDTRGKQSVLNKDCEQIGYCTRSSW